jgi:acyl-[acyl-carrier-protein]-phospholipid O-acyltransferase/long-chain-fatty-acid--[acyl-carrier-protein] ligase
LPFVVAGGWAGYCGDRYSKSRVIFVSKIAEIVVMALGLVAFWFAPQWGFIGLWTVLFLMGLQSTFFGPGKYGSLPEMLRPQDLARGNGLIITTTFLAIIFGTSSAGALGDALIDPTLPRFEAMRQLWKGSILCIAIAVVGTVTSMFIRYLRPAEPGLQPTKDLWGVPKATGQLMWRDRPLFWALMASCVFWLIAGMAMQAVNNMGVNELELSYTQTSLLVAIISVGIAIGGGLGGYLSRSRVDTRIMMSGLWIIFLCLLVLGLAAPLGAQRLGVWPIRLLLVGLGIGAAFFSMPIQVFLQDRPPPEFKGRTIAVMNQANFLAIVVSGILFLSLVFLFDACGWPASAAFWVMAVLLLPVLIWFRIDPAETHGDPTEESEAA